MKHWCKGHKFLSCLTQLTLTEQQHTWSGRWHHSGCMSHYQELVERLSGSSLGSHCCRRQRGSLASEVKRRRLSGCPLGRPATGFCLWPWRRLWRKQCCFGWQWRRWHQCHYRWRRPEGSRSALDRSALPNASRLRTICHHCGQSWRHCLRVCCCLTGWTNMEHPPIDKWEITAIFKQTKKKDFTVHIPKNGFPLSLFCITWMTWRTHGCLYHSST